MQMKTLDFTECPLPLADRILKIIKRCPNAGIVLILTIDDLHDASNFHLRLNLLCRRRLFYTCITQLFL